MSFGYPQPVDEIRKAIKHAYHKNVLLLAAASNCGGNHRRSWPARAENVMCIYATDGDGNKYAKNPTPAENEYKFAALGSSVQALWPPSRKGPATWVRKSGTSTATPICAAIAGIVITILRRYKDRYLNEAFPEAERDKEEDSYMQKLEALGSVRGMAAVFRLMASERDHYQYVAPWTFLHTNRQSRTTMVETILQNIDA